MLKVAHGDSFHPFGQKLWIGRALAGRSLARDCPPAITQLVRIKPA
jgi:hypothetical protein